ncbi:MAG: zinc ribbon domain-containing protein [Oscillospiraceae bacterium]
MSGFDNLLNKAVSVANTTGKKANEVLEASKLKIQGANLQNEMQKQFETLGVLTYQEKKSDVDNGEAIDKCITEIDTIRVKLDVLNGKIGDIKQMKKCSNCMNINPEDGIYCQRCGAKLD